MSHPLTFSADWLALREPADLAARSEALADELSRVLRRAYQSPRILDLAAGTGANLRALAPHLPASDWTLVDQDPELLEQATVRTRAWADAQGCKPIGNRARAAVMGPELFVTWATAVVDLRDLMNGSSSEEPSAPGVLRYFEGRTVVTASALLDLVSETFVLTLARVCWHARQTVYFALTYDGRIRCTPSEPDDEVVRDLFNGHQHTDKGFGPALGPEATTRTAQILTDVGYRVRTESSDWMLGVESAELQRQLLAGWANAASEVAPEQAATITAWLTRRLAHVDAGRSLLAVGHGDLLATRIG